jgi:cell division protease FtsH
MLELPAGMLAPALQVSQTTQARIDAAVRGIVMGGFERATTLLSRNRAVLEHAARALLEKETLDEAAVRALTVDLQRDEAAVPRLTAP